MQHVKLSVAPVFIRLPLFLLALSLLFLGVSSGADQSSSLEHVSSNPIQEQGVKSGELSFFSGIVPGRLAHGLVAVVEPSDTEIDLESHGTSSEVGGVVSTAKPQSLFRLQIPPTGSTSSKANANTSDSTTSQAASGSNTDEDVVEHPVEIITNLRLAHVADADVAVDGELNEAVWSTPPLIETMKVVEPDTLGNPRFSTETRIFYTSNGLYIAANMDQPRDTLVQRLSARDKDLNRDGFAITIDTSGEGLFGFWFALNLGDSKEDGKVSPERSFSREWDGAWQGATAVTESGWSAEIFIPWSIIAMPPGESERRMNFFVSRKVAHLNERYGWPALPFTGSRFMSALQPMQMRDVNPKQQWELYPYVASSADAINDEQNNKTGLNFSWRPAPNLQVSGALNPDFAAVESDDVVVNLTAFETYFPEKRFFFLEGSEVFQTTPRSARFSGSSTAGTGARTAPSTYNPEPTTLVNTRRIGGAAKQVDVPDGTTVIQTERSKPTDLLGAVKVVGQTDQFRFGLLGAAEDEAELRATLDDTGEATVVTAEGRNFGVARLLWDRPMTSGRQSHGYIHTFVDTPEYQSTVHGLDSHFLTKSGKLSVDTQLIHSDADDVLGYGGFADIRFTPRQGLFHRISIDYLDDQLDVSDLGFLNRNDMRGVRYTSFRTTSQGLPSYLRARNIGIFSAANVNSENELVRGYLGTGLTFFFQNQSTINVQYSWRPAMVDDKSSRGNRSFEAESGAFSVATFGTDSSKPFSYSVQVGTRDDELGDTAVFFDTGFTFSPVSRFSFDYDIRYRDSKGWVLYSGDSDFTRYLSEQLSQLLSVDLFLSAKQQFRATMQWTGIDAIERDFWMVPLVTGPLLPREVDPDRESGDFTISRLTAQVRYRWEIAPLSEFFLVYTRGSNISGSDGDSFGQLLKDAFDEPIVDILIMKLRYRFGS